jgi:DNA-directed RNA polymerase specialized sigma24 family protein
MGTFEDLYRQHVHSLFRFARSITGNREEAEDLTGGAFLALYRNLAAIDQSLPMSISRPDADPGGR